MTTDLAITVPLGRFGPPALIAGEDRAAYEGLAARVTEAVAPADVLEEIWVRDIVDLAWDAFRLRRFKAAFIAANACQGLAALLRPLVGYPDSEDLAAKWARRSPAALERVATVTGVAGLPADAALAQTLALRLGEVERIDRLITAAELRRSAALRELERHRAASGGAASGGAASGGAAFGRAATGGAGVRAAPAPAPAGAAVP